jgi:hypothetical protein
MMQRLRALSPCWMKAEFLEVSAEWLGFEVLDISDEVLRH